MKNLFLASLAFFALAAAASKPKTQEPNPEKEAFLSARYERFKKSCAQKDAKACKRAVRFYKEGAAKKRKGRTRSDGNFKQDVRRKGVCRVRRAGRNLYKR